MANTVAVLEWTPAQGRGDSIACLTAGATAFEQLSPLNPFQDNRTRLSPRSPRGASGKYAPKGGDVFYSSNAAWAAARRAMGTR